MASPAGGYAVQAHGLLERPSEDVDMFTTTAAGQAFAEALRAAIAAYRAVGLDVELLVENDSFARLTVHEPLSGRNSKVELGIDWRPYPPTVPDIGPVLSRDDAVANKVCPVLTWSGSRSTPPCATRPTPTRNSSSWPKLTTQGSSGLTSQRALNAVRRLPLAEFTAYGLRPDEARRLVDRMVEWAASLR